VQNSTTDTPNNLSLYLEYQKDIQPGDLISYLGNGDLSQIIAQKTPPGKPVRSHVSGVVPGWEGYPRRIIIEADQGEVNVRALSAKLAYYNGRAWWHPLRPGLDVFRGAISRYYWEHVGVDYDEGGVVQNLFGYVDADDSKLWCSELSGLANCQIPIGLMAPVNAAVRLLMDGKGLRPCDCAMLPIYLPPVQIL
jgi:hypothetical protein